MRNGCHSAGEAGFLKGFTTLDHILVLLALIDEGRAHREFIAALWISQKSLVIYSPQDYHSPQPTANEFLFVLLRFVLFVSLLFKASICFIYFHYLSVHNALNGLELLLLFFY